MTDFETVYDRICRNFVADPPWDAPMPVIVQRCADDQWQCTVVHHRYPNVCQGTMVSAHGSPFPEPITGNWYVLRGPGEQGKLDVVAGIGKTLPEAMLALEKNLARSDEDSPLTATDAEGKGVEPASSGPPGQYAGSSERSQSSLVNPERKS